MRIENWSVVSSGGPFDYPELCVQCLHGFVYGHPLFDDGTEITTSALSGAIGERIRTHSGHVYELRDADPHYLVAHPGAKRRLIMSLLENGEVQL